jgi:predicted membrane protein
MEPIEVVTDFLDDHKDFRLWIFCFFDIIWRLTIFAFCIGVLTGIGFIFYRAYKDAGIVVPSVILGLLTVTTIYWDFRRRIEKKRDRR